MEQTVERKLTTEQQKLVEDNHTLIYSYLHKNSLGQVDWYGVCALGLCKAAKTYNPMRGAFSTYAFTCMHYEVLSEMLKLNAKKRNGYTLLSLEEPLSEEGFTLGCQLADSACMESNVVLRLSLEEFCYPLSDRERQVFLLYISGLKYKEIGERLRISPSRVCQLLKLMRTRAFDVLSAV